MRGRVLVVLMALAATGVGCEIIAGLHDHCAPLDCGDAAPDVAFESTTNASYSFTAAPSSVVVEPAGAAAAVSITLTRTAGFAEAIALSLVNAPPGVSGSAIIPGNQSTGTLNVFADATAKKGDLAQATISAQSTPSNIAATQPLLVRVGHVLLVASASTTFVVPQDVHNATITAWGAGGGGGMPTNVGAEQGAAGGAGGFAEATFALTPGTTLDVIVGAPGVAGTSASYYGQGGSGGGFSGVEIGAALVDAGVDAASDAGDAGTSYLLIAGGGAGGGGGFYYLTTPSLSGPGKVGGAGSGGTGTDGSSATGGGNGGTPTAGGATGTTCFGGSAGTFLQGGSGNKGPIGGLPGGGNGGSQGGGGGGGGYYGGGAGGSASPTCSGGNGGGGGGGHVDATGTSVATLAGTGATPPSTNHKYYVNNVATGGAATTSGGVGHVVISVP